MKNTLTKLAAAGALTLSATAAFAGSETAPGITIGTAAGSPLPPGIYFIDESNWGVRDSTSGPLKGTKTAIGETVPIAVWATPWSILGGHLSFAAALPLVEVGITSGEAKVPGTTYAESVFNPYFNARLAWQLGGGFSFSYSAGYYARLNTSSNQTAFDSNNFEQRFGLSYLANGWNLTANLLWGIQERPVGAVTSLSFGLPTANPDYVNVDLTAIKSFGKWELGAVGFYSADVSDPFAGYARQKQFALGALVGYNFGPLSVQSYVTRDVWQENYNGLDTRVWTRIVVPLGDPLASAPSSGLLYKK